MEGEVSSRNEAQMIASILGGDLEQFTNSSVPTSAASTEWRCLS